MWALPSNCLQRMSGGAGIGYRLPPIGYRDLNGGASSPTRSFIARHWHITYTLILINIVVYGLQLIIPFRWVYNLGMMSGPRVHHGEYYRLITHGFIHSQNDPMHMVWNMITSSSSVYLSNV